MLNAGRFILIIEDEYLIAGDLAAEFMRMGCPRIEMAADTTAALSMLQQYCPDGAVLDLHLRGHMAFPLAALLLRRRIPFVFMTGHDGRIIPWRFRTVVRCQKPLAARIVAAALLDVMRQASLG